MDKQPVGQLPDLTQSNNNDEIMVITNDEYNQLKKEKISDFITDLTSTDENNAIIKGTDGKLFTKDFGNASNITEGTLPVSVLPDIPKDKLPDIEITDLPASGVTADTYAYPSSVTVNAQGMVTAIAEGTPSGANANTDLSNITEAGKEVIRENSYGGLEVGDIGIAALGVDETKGLRRYLNGQILTANANNQGFINKLKSTAALYPSIVCTETEWQGIAAASVGGQCGKFVINYDTDETTVLSVRLPKIIMPIQGLTDLTKLGEIVEAGLPDHNHTVAGNYSFRQGHGSETPLVLEQLSSYSGMASQTNPVYGKSDTVQQEQIQYPYFIQIATGVEYEVNITNEIELNNPYSLLDVKWSDKILNNISWLRSAGQSNSGTVYVDAYNLILSEYNSAEDEQETIGETTITFRRGQTTGIKITTDKTSFDAILAETGTAWYYVLDTTNTAFYLPQTNGFLQFGTTAGKFNEAGLPDHKHTVTVYPQIGSGGWIYGGTGFRFGPSTATTSLASANNPIYGNSETVQPNAVEGYLYFYVGETVQNANLINAGKIPENYATKDYAVDAGFPGNKYVDLSLAGSDITYTAPADGWFAFSKTAGANYQNANMRNMTTEYNVISHGSWTGTTCRLMCPARKGEQVYLNYDTSGATNYFRFIYAHGEV